MHIHLNDDASSPILAIVTGGGSLPSGLTGPTSGPKTFLRQAAQSVMRVGALLTDRKRAAFHSLRLLIQDTAYLEVADYLACCRFVLMPEEMGDALSLPMEVLFRGPATTEEFIRRIIDSDDISTSVKAAMVYRSRQMQEQSLARFDRRFVYDETTGILLLHSKPENVIKALRAGNYVSEAFYRDFGKREHLDLPPETQEGRFDGILARPSEKDSSPQASRDFLSYARRAKQEERARA